MRALLSTLALLLLSNSSAVQAQADTSDTSLTDSAISPTRLGLIGMVERAQSVDGSIQIDSTKQGTKICLLLPLEIITASPV
jgi:signal transduction histidine kinase